MNKPPNKTIEGRGGKSWSFLSITAVGVLIMPFSDFWLLLISTVGLFRWQRKKVE